MLKLQTGLFFGLWDLMLFCDCACALFPHLISSSGVCGTLGRERRLLQPRFVVRALTLCLSAFTCMIRRPFQRPQEDSMSFRDFFFYYCKHEDCILHADNSRASLHSSLLGTVWLFGGIMKDFDHFKFINKGRKNWKIEKLCWKAYVLKFFIVPQQ